MSAFQGAAFPGTCPCGETRLPWSGWNRPEACDSLIPSYDFSTKAAAPSLSFDPLERTSPRHRSSALSWPGQPALELGILSFTSKGQFQSEVEHSGDPHVLSTRFHGYDAGRILSVYTFSASSGGSWRKTYNVEVGQAEILKWLLGLSPFSVQVSLSFLLVSWEVGF